MKKIRKLLLDLIPSVKETMAYKLPTYGSSQRILFALASQKNHMSLYVIHYDLLDNFKEESTLFNKGKSCLRLTKLTDKFVNAIKRIIKGVIERQEESMFFKKYLSSE